jgi:hypothetical protein
MSFRHVRVVMTALSIESRKVVRGPLSQATPATRGQSIDAPWLRGLSLPLHPALRAA